MDFIVLLVVILSDPTSTLVVTMSFMIISNLSGSELVGLWFLLHMVTPYGPSVTVGVFGIAHNAILFEKPIFGFTGYNNIINFTGVGIIWFILHVVGLSGSELVVNLDVGFFGPKSPFITVGKAGLDVRMVDPNISFMVLLV
jgi:hypothetical protein